MKAKLHSLIIVIIPAPIDKNFSYLSSQTVLNFLQCKVYYSGASDKDPPEKRTQYK